MDILADKGKVILLGNEAVVRGALESGVKFVSTYPGTPASEIGDTFNKIKNQISNLKNTNQKSKIKNDFYFEYSVNEKTALEAGIGASFSGLKTLVAMKSFGLNVAADSLLPFLYTGSRGPFVLVAADDPNCHGSAQSEQNSRGFAGLAHIPTLEPADPQECKDLTKFALQISEKYKIPVMIRLTTRVAHQQMPVLLGKIRNSQFAIRKFEKDPNQYVTMPPRVLEMKTELLEKIEKIRKEVAEKNAVNLISGGSTSRGGRTSAGLGVIASGVSYLYAMEALQKLNLNLPVLKLGMFYPLAEEKIAGFIKNIKKVLIVEELEPYLEKEIERIAKTANPNLEIFGKSHLPQVGELRPEFVSSAIAKILNKKILPDYNQKLQATSYRLQEIKHLPRFCAQCPYWKVFAAIKQAAPKNTIFGGDIGCYMMAAFPPLSRYDYMSSMGSSVGIGHGIAKSARNKVIAFIGDSTFFHAGIPAILNAVQNNSQMLVIILDNRITAMTGHQPRPGITESGEEKEIKIEKVSGALGVKNLKKIDQVKNYPLFLKTIKDFLNKPGVSVIIAEHPCWLYYKN